MAITVGSDVITFSDDSTIGSYFAAGTLMLFQQSSAPTGWTKQSTHNNKALRCVTGTASSGGSSTFTSALGTPSVSVGSTTLSVTEIPSHRHGGVYNNVSTFIGGGAFTGLTGIQNQGVGEGITGAQRNGATSAAGGGGSHTHGSSTATINVQYVDVIIAAKD